MVLFCVHKELYCVFVCIDCMYICEKYLCCVMMRVCEVNVCCILYLPRSKVGILNYKSKRNIAVIV